VRPPLRRARLKLACRLAEKAYLAGQRVFVRLPDAAQLASFDELLWSFADRSFVPHEPFSDPGQWQHTAVLLGREQPAPPDGYDLLLNLVTDGDAPALDGSAAQPARIIEIVDADETRRQAGRQRYRGYRERGLNPQIHHIADGTGP
jgi:DNA polymerase III subunit chi